MTLFEVVLCKFQVYNIVTQSFNFLAASSIMWNLSSPNQGSEPALPAVEAKSLNYPTTREIPSIFKVYIPFIVIIKYLLYSLYCTIYPVEFLFSHFLKFGSTS